MKILSLEQARTKVQAFRNKHATHKAAAEAAGCTESQISHALRLRSPICPALQQAAGISRATVYVDVAEVPDGYTHT